MALLRNPEIQAELLLDLGITVLASLLGLLLSPLASAALLLMGLALTGLHLFFGAKRYARIAALSKELDDVLHGEQRLIESSDEGELSILYHELHKMTLRLQEQAEQLQAEKVQLTEAIADIFHQVRTPLTSMQLALTLLNDPDLLYEQRLSLTQELKRQTSRIHWLVETLLKLSKLDAGTARFVCERQSARSLLECAAEPFRISMELREQTLLLEVKDEQLLCDPAWTVEAFGNLLKNAMEHTPAGGTIRVTVSETPLFCELLFTDTGEGFDPTDLPHLFERYYKGKNATVESIGIGLALTRQILAAENATIAAQNVPTGGACFAVRFYKSVI